MRSSLSPGGCRHGGRRCHPALAREARLLRRLLLVDVVLDAGYVVSGAVLW